MRFLLIVAFVCALMGNEIKGKNVEKIEYLKINDSEIPVISEISHSLPIGFVRIIFNGGGNISNDKIALSAFVADILERGTKSKGEYNFANELESSAINLSVDNGLETLGISIEFLKEFESSAISLLGELLKEPNLTLDALNQTKLSLKSYLLSKENDFSYIARVNLKKEIFANTKLENPEYGTIEDIEKISLNDVEKFISRTFTLNNAVILIGGDLNLSETKEKLKNILSFLPSGKEYKSPKITLNANARDITDIKPTKQAIIYFASPFKFGDYESELHKSQVMSFIMGSSGFGSRIMEEIRVKRGLAYSAVFFNAINNVTSCTMGVVQTKLESKDEAVSAIKETISDFIKNGATLEELNGAKSYILGSRVLSNETLEQRLGKKYMNFHRGLPLDFDETLVKNIENLSLDEINEYIKSHIEVENLVFSVVVDK